MLAQMTICEASPEDLPHIAAIEQLPGYDTFVGSWTVEQHRQAFADPDCLYLVAKDPSGEVSGFVILRGLHSENRSIEIKRLAVRRPNQGLGRRLLEVALDRAFNLHGAHRVWLDLFDTNTRARHVYQSLGFSLDGVFREAVLRNGQYFSLLLMSLLDREFRARSANLPTS